MKVVKFSSKKHYAPLIECLVARQAYIPTINEMPKLGYIAFDGKVPVAFVFLRKVEGGYGQIDGLTTNPGCSASQRDQGIRLVIDKLLATCRKTSIFNVLVLSKEENTLMRSHEYGFEKLPLTVMAVDLKKRG